MRVIHGKTTGSCARCLRLNGISALTAIAIVARGAARIVRGFLLALQFPVAMEVIPVLDIKHGKVVLADGGRREQYRPVARSTSTICSDPEPQDVVESFLRIFPFTTFYVADLDAIAANGDNFAIIKMLTISYPQVSFWIDAGIADPRQLLVYGGLDGAQVIIGSETLPTIDAYTAVINAGERYSMILSLDYKDGANLGPPELIQRPEQWTPTVIAMDLGHVGRAAGPNLKRIQYLLARRADLNVVAAGGIRDVQDLRALAARGVDQTLVATALHKGRIGARELTSVA